MREHISAKGSVHLRIFNAQGELIEDTRQDNLIVNVGKQSIAALVGAATANKRVAKIGYGTAATPTAGAQTSIENPFVKALDGVSYSGTSVSFEFSLDNPEDNGVTIRELALFSVDDTMFSRITRNPIDKTSDIRIEGTWTITF